MSHRRARGRLGVSAVSLASRESSSAVRAVVKTFSMFIPSLTVRRRRGQLRRCPPPLTSAAIICLVARHIGLSPSLLTTCSCIASVDRAGLPHTVHPPRPRPTPIQSRRRRRFCIFLSLFVSTSLSRGRGPWGCCRHKLSPPETRVTITRLAPGAVAAPLRWGSGRGRAGGRRSPRSLGRRPA